MKKRFLSLLMVLVMVFNLFPATVFAESKANDGSVKVTFAATSFEFIFVPETITVTDGIAEEYGYSNKDGVDKPTFVDAMVAAHKLKYGDAFTKETAEDYLAITTSGFITKAFGEEASSSGILINGSMPGALSANEATLKNGDVAQFLLYQDTDFWSDWYTTFTERSKTVLTGEEFTLNLVGHSLMSEWGPSWNNEPVYYDDEAAADVLTICTVNEDGSLSEAISGKTTDSNGNVTLSFPESGTYIVTASGLCDDDCPVALPWCIVTVKDFKGEGTEESPYEIGSASDLERLAKLTSTDGFAGKYFVMTDDITLPDSWTPIGSGISIPNGQAPFCGDFDGGNHKLTVPEGGLPLFGYVRNATISNLKIYGEKIEGYGLINNYCVDNGAKPRTATINNVTLLSGTKTLKSGLIGGYASGSNSIVIDSCTIEKGVVIGYDKAQSNIGGFAGEFNGTITNCINAGAVYGVDFVGGIVANKGQTMGDFDIENCTFSGTVTASGNYAGGISGAGYGGTMWGFSSAKNTPCPVIHNCLISGSVSGVNQVGGILGAEAAVVQCWENGTGKIHDNVFVGTVSGSQDVGGIVGCFNGLDKYTIIENNYYIEGCGATVGIGRVNYIDTSAEHETQSGATYYSTADGKASGISGASKKDHNRTDDPLGKDADKLAKAMTAAQMADGTVVKLLNASENSNHNWIQSEKSPAISKNPIVYAFDVSGEYKTNYCIGEELDLDNMVFTATWSDGKTTTVDQTDVKVKGFDNTKRGVQTVTLTYSNVFAKIDVTVLKPEGADINVTLSILGDNAHGENGETHTFTDGNLTDWVNASQYTVDNNATVKDVIEKVMNEKGMTFSNPSGNYIESITYNGVTLGEFTNGSNSGWMYLINNVHGNLGVSEQYLEDGDVIIFHYTDDYTQESTIAPEITPQNIINLINAIGKVDVTSGSAINAARTAYDSLNDAQQKKVTNYQVLLDAEKTYAGLIAGQAQKVDGIYSDTISYLASLGTPGVGTTGGEWMVIALARSGHEVPDGYYDAVVKYVQDNIDINERLSKTKSTENSRIILALTAIGKDVTNVGGHNLLNGLNEMSYIKKQGINGSIWALIALDSHNYTPAGDVTREKLINAIVDLQLSDGGWALSGDKFDPDVTAMAIQALASYYKANAKARAVESEDKIKTAVDNAIACLADMQLPTGAYSSYGSVNSESCAQVIVALCALGIDPATDSRFVKNGVSVLDALCSFSVEGGGFKHTSDGSINGMATEQCSYALAAYSRMKDGSTSLFDMSEVSIVKNDDKPGEGGETAPDAGDKPSEGGETAPDAGNKPSEGGETAPDAGNKPSEGGETTPDAGSNPSGSGEASPGTGDEGNMMLWLLLALMGGAGVIALNSRGKEDKAA